MKIGQKVSKISKKPFKSGKRVETIVGFGTNTSDPEKRNCVTFEDGSICNIDMIKIEE